ncbi:MAG: FkbM family methyltransferase [Williamsia sp.]|nr:FkbM family methyltransferase [Williamsia sp.]
MQTLSLNPAFSTRTVLTAGIIKVLEFFKFSHQPVPVKNKPDKSSTAYLLHLIEKGQTVFKIGPHDASALYFLSQKVGDAGKVVAFEPRTNVYAYLTEIKQLLSWSNVIIEHSPLTPRAGQQPVILSKKDKASYKGATVVRFDVKYKKSPQKGDHTAGLDKYCAAKNIYPDVLRIDADGDEFDLLTGSLEMLKSHKPRIVVSCEDRKAGREKIQSLFRLLIALNYKGHFLLDAMLLPLDNFDFDVYQNPYSDFYCNTFVFV